MPLIIIFVFAVRVFQAANLRNELKSLTKVGGLTACYDSIWMALDELQDADTNSEDIIVCLTDGSDNRSRHTLSEVCERIKDEYYDRVRVIVIALGILDNREHLKQIAYSSKNGTYIQAAADVKEMSGAFEKVSKTLSHTATSNTGVRIETM